MKQVHFILLSLVVFCTEIYSQTSQADFSFKQSEELDSLQKITLWSTQYYIHEFQSGGTIPIVDHEGNATNLFADTCNFCEAALEGTAFVTDSSGKISVINFVKRGDTRFVDCRKCKKYAGSKLAVESWGQTLWSISSGFGDGVKNYRLVPFRTIAVDSKIIPYGTVVFIPKAKGKIIDLPNGEKVKHDGYFFAGDTGGAIKNSHIDVFTGIYSGNPFPDVVQSNENKTFDAYLITDETIIKELRKIHVK